MINRFYLAGLAASVLACVAGVTLSLADPAVAQSGVLRPLIILLASFLVSTTALLLSDRFATRDEMRRVLDVASDHISTSVLQTVAFRQFSNADKALDYAILQMPQLKRVWNTKLSPSGLATGREISRKFELALRGAVMAGARVHDVVSVDHVEYANELAAATSQGQGSYVYDTLVVSHPSLNILVLEHQNGLREGFLGWPISKESRAEMPVFMSTDARLVDFLISYHEILGRWDDARV